MAISGGISWVELTEPLETTNNATWNILFLVYIAFVYFFIQAAYAIPLTPRRRSGGAIVDAISCEPLGGHVWTWR
eukprot:5757538-Pyramimonas_sp.AAC.1